MQDAHCHYHDARLADSRADWLAKIAVSRAVVNGTCEADWDAVALMAAEHIWAMPSFGLHPWQVNERSQDWQRALTAKLDAHPRCGIGEIGLDRWITGHDIEAQKACFLWQLEAACERDLPASIHCIQAWGALWDILQTGVTPARGYLIHAYGGPREMVAGFVKTGAYFSFSPYFFHERKALQREIFAEIPMDRLLVETDAPDLAPPAEHNPHLLIDAGGNAINHPANIAVAYEGLAKIRGISVQTLDSVVTENFARFFASP